MSPLLWWLASAALRLYCAVMRPRALECPRGFWLPTGIRPSGDFACAPLVTGDPARDGAGGSRDDSVQPEGELAGAIYCVSGERAIVVDDRHVECRGGVT